MKTILVTGGSGFLGSHLCKSLLLKNNKVICIDNNITGKMENLSSIINNILFIKHDINNDINSILAQYNILHIDEIYNMACPASPPQYQGKNAIFTTKTCTIGVMNVLETARKFNAKVLQASTSEVYGNPEISPQKEDYFGNVNPCGPRSCYDEGKRCAESIFFDYNRIFGVHIKIVRIFNTYGPNMDKDDGRVVSNFINQAINNQPITVYGDGTQTRSLCYVDDLICGIIKMMESESSFHGPVNLGNTAEMTVLEIAKFIISKANSKSEIIFQPLPQDDPIQRRPDISLAKEKLGWVPIVSLDNGIQNTINYFRDKIHPNTH